MSGFPHQLSFPDHPKEEYGISTVVNLGLVFNFLKNPEKQGVGMLNDAEFVL